MIGKIRLSILIILLVATCVYAGWESGLLLQGIKTVLAQQLSRMMEAKVSIARIDVYGSFAIVKGLDIKHRDYGFSCSELILEYDLGKILAGKFDVAGGIRRITVLKPKISFREMEWKEIRPLVAPSWEGFMKIASRIQSTDICLIRGRWELGLMSIDDLYLNANLSRKKDNYIPVKLALKGVFSAPKIKLPLSFKSEIGVEDKKIRLEGKIAIGDLPNAGFGTIKGSIFNPENPGILLDVALDSKKLKFENISMDSLRTAVKLRGESGSFRSSGKFYAAKAYVYGQEITDLSFSFRDDTGSFEVQGEAGFAQGRFRLSRGVYKKEKKPRFEGIADFLFKNYEVPLSFLYSEGNLNIRKVSVLQQAKDGEQRAAEKKTEVLLDGAGAGKLTKKRMSFSLKFDRGKYRGISLGMDFPFAENLEKKLNVAFGNTCSLDAAFRVSKDEIPIKLKAVLSKLSLMGRKISGNVDFSGKLRFNKTFLLEGKAAINSLKLGIASEKKALEISNSVVRIKYDGEKVLLYPQLINGREARGEVKFQRDKCVLNIVYFLETAVSIRGEIAYNPETIVFSALKINNMEINGNINLRSKSIDLSVNINNENPALFTNLVSIFIPRLKKFKFEEEANVKGFIRITGLIDKPCVQGNIEYTAKALNYAKIEGLKYEGETLVFNLGMKWGESSLSADVIAKFSREKIDVGLNGGLNLIVGKKENPAILVDAPFYLNGEIKNIQTSPRFFCDFGFRDPMINKKLGRSLKVNLQYSEGTLEFLPVASQVDYYPVGKITFEEQFIKIVNFYFCRGEAQPLSVNGLIIPDEHNIDLTVNFNEEMGNLAVFFPQDINRANGKILANLHIAGDFRDPVILGDFKILDGEIAFVGTKEILKNINASLDFETGVIRVDTKTGIGRTTLFVNGNMEYGGWLPTRLNLHLNNDFTTPLRVSIPQFVDGEIALSLDITGEVLSPTVKGIINIMNMSFTNWPTGDAGGLGFLSKLKWDVDMIFKGNNRYYNDFVQGEVKRDSSFNFKWDGNSLFVKGRGEAERGNFIYMGAEFTLMKGASYTVDTSLEGEKAEMRAYLDAKGVAKIGKTTLTLVFSGEMGKIEPVLTSEPPLSKEQMMLLLNPQYANLSSQQIDVLLKDQAITLLAGTLESKITRPFEGAVRRTFRVDVFKVRSEMIKGIIKATSSSAVTPLSFLTPLEGTSVEVGKYIAENLYVDYKAILQSEKVTSEWGVEYAFVKDMKMRYAFRPKEDPLKTEHEVFLEMGLRF